MSSQNIIKFMVFFLKSQMISVFEIILHINTNRNIRKTSIYYISLNIQNILYLIHIVY